MIEKSKISRRRVLKRASRKLLFSDWLTQIFVFLIVGVVFYGISQFGAALAFSVNEITANENTAKVISSVFIVFATAILVPVVYGLFAFEINAVSGKKSNPSDIFIAFTSGERLFRAYDLFFGLVFRYALCFLPAFFLNIFNTIWYSADVFSHSFYFEGIDIVLFGFRTLFVLLLYAGIALSSKGFVAVYVAVKTDKDIRECFWIAKRCMWGNSIETLKFALSFFPLFVISMFTVGFMYILYTIPYMFISFVMLAKYLYEKNLYRINNQSYVPITNIDEISE